MKTIEEQAAEFSKFDSATDIGTDLGSYRQGLFEGFLAGYETCRNHIHLHWKEEWKDLYKRIEESCLPAMDAMEGRYLHQVKELKTKIVELETQLENWQHNAVHGDEGL